MKSASQSRTCPRNGKGLSRSTKLLRALVDSDWEGILVVSEKGEVVFANRQAEELWGYDSGKMTGLGVSRLFHRQVALIDWGQGTSNGCKPIRIEGVRGDGEKTGLAVKLRHLTLEQQDYRVLIVTPLALRTEEEIVEEQVRVFESLEILAGGLAHEFNNILTGIMGNLHLAMETGARRGRLDPNLLEGAYASTLRARAVTRELFQVSQGDQPNQGANALPQLVCEASVMSLAGSRVQIEYDFPSDLRAAFIDAAQIGQVVHQLLRFAAERMRHNGLMRVEARNFRVNPGDSGFCGELLPADYVLLSITTPDESIESPDCTRLFEPYRVGGNALSGLSLAICRSQVRRHGGLLRAAATENGELRLEVYLPACRDVSNQAVALLRVDVPCVEGCHVLVMDDEELVRMVLKRSLEGMGHRVEIVADGQEAITVYEDAKSRGDRFDVVFLDLAIPCGTGGKETCRELLDLDPQATCVLISGSIGDEAMLDPLKHGFVENLEKPFDLHEVGQVMNHLMERMGKGSARINQAFEDAVAMGGGREPSNVVPVDFGFSSDRV